VGSFILRKKNKPEAKFRDSVDALPIDDTSVFSEEFAIPTFGLRFHVPLWLVDNLNNSSSRLFASSLGGLKIAPNIQVAGTGGGVGEAQFKTAVDPFVELRAVFPWDGGFRRYIEEAVEEVVPEVEEDPGGLVEEVYGDFAWAMPREPLPGWSIDISPNAFNADDGAEVPLRLELSALTPGITVFFIEATAEGGEVGAVSELALLEADENGELTLDP
jgi:hypothetical protein